MLAASTLSKLAPQARLGLNQARQMSVVSGPPTVKVTFAEKVIHGLVIVGGICATPAYVLVNIKNYRA